MGGLTLEKSRNKFSKLAWLSACISLLIGLSHVRSFPSYNIALSLVALYASVQEDTEALLKSITVCGIMGVSSIAADVAFCSLWAREIIDGYSGVLKFCLILFIGNMFVKVPLLYSAMTVAVTASSESNEENNGNERSLTPPMHSPKSIDISQEEMQTPGSSFRSEAKVGDHSMDMPTSPTTPGIAGLVSPGYDPRASYSYSP